MRRVHYRLWCKKSLRNAMFPSAFTLHCDVDTRLLRPCQHGDSLTHRYRTPRFLSLLWACWTWRGKPCSPLSVPRQRYTKRYTSVKSHSCLPFHLVFVHIGANIQFAGYQDQITFLRSSVCPFVSPEWPSSRSSMVTNFDEPQGRTAARVA
jgi:hypothetical protein